MRIALISGQANPLALGRPGTGGKHTHVAALSDALARLGHDVVVYTRRDDPALPDCVNLESGVTIEHMPAGPAAPVPADEQLPLMGDFGRALAARWSRPGAGPDVVHAHYWLSGLAALTATNDDRRPVVVTYHGLASAERRQLPRDHMPRDHSRGPGPRAGLERTLGSIADRVVAQSEDEVAELGRMGVRRSGTVIVPSGVDTDRFTPGGPAADHRRPGLRRILSVGPLVARKGFADLVAALRRVPGAELVVVGGPDPSGVDRDPEARRLLQLADRHGVADRLRIVGAVGQEELAGWYRSADVLACTPWYEPFGLTPLEAMACGVPVVAYASGGIAESVIDNVTGVLVPPRDTVAMATALRGLLGDEVRRMSFASAAIDRVRSRYTWDRAATEMERVYRSVTGVVADAEPADETDEDDEALSEVS
ncbi:glycosyltransferase [Dactylosporangium sp. NPDC051485]|uniref:glycosyltransferase n=1 Tax=Dactylosporangium sp. NPDC051485 TaxID=3154846 RepID=UPI003448C3D8